MIHIFFDFINYFHRFFLFLFFVIEMPYYRSSYYRYARRWPYRSWRRSGVARSQQQGNRRFTVSIPIEGYGLVGVLANQRYSRVMMFQPFYNSDSDGATDGLSKYGNVVGNEVFQIYCRLYDEVKVDSMSVQIAVQGLPAGVNGFKLVSAVDRHVNLHDIFNLQTTAQLFGSPESMSRVFTSLQNAKQYRVVYARDLGERTTFCDSTLGTRDVAAAGGVDAYQQRGLLEFLNEGLYSCFVPGISVGFECSSSPATAGYCTVQYKCVYKFTFRNPKYSGIGGMSRGVETFSEARAAEMSDLKERSESDGIVEEEKEAPVKKKEKVVYEEEVLPDDDDTLIDDDDDEEESQAPLTQPFKSPVKKAGKKG